MTDRAWRYLPGIDDFTVLQGGAACAGIIACPFFNPHERIYPDSMLVLEPGCSRSFDFPLADFVENYKLGRGPFSLTYNGRLDYAVANRSFEYIRIGSFDHFQSTPSNQIELRAP